MNVTVEHLHTVATIFSLARHDLAHYALPPTATGRNEPGTGGTDACVGDFSNPLQGTPGGAMA